MARTPLGLIAGLGPLVSTLDQLAKLEARTSLFDAGTQIAEEIAQNARDRLGHYQTGWAELAEATQADREARGYPANEPLLRTGSEGYEGVLGTGLRGSITWAEESGPDPYAAYFVIGVPADSEAADYAAVQELGSLNLRHPIPPRPFLVPAADEIAPRAREIVGAKVKATIAMAAPSGSPTLGGFFVPGLFSPMPLALPAAGETTDMPIVGESTLE